MRHNIRRSWGKLTVIATVAIVVLAVTFVIVMTHGVSRRVAVPIQEAWLAEPNTIQLTVDTCGGDPEVSQIRESDEIVEVRVVSLRTWGGSGNDCLDMVEVRFGAPLGERILIDVTSGREIEVQGR